MRKVVVFGIFDGVHDGHRSLFSQALLQAQAVRGSEEPSGSRRGKAKEEVELIVVVGRDSASLQWKNKKPRYSEKTRLHLVLSEKQVDRVVLGDEEQSSYKILEELKPDIICLGYDQDILEQDLGRWLKEKGENVLLIRLKPH